MDNATVWVIAGLAVVLGVTLQRLSGMGTGLVLAPTLSALFGGAVGVLMSNVAAIASAGLILWAVRDRVAWRRGATLVGWALPGAVLGALFVLVVPAAWLTIIVGVVVLVALGNSYLRPHLRERHGLAVTAVAGGVGGLFNTTAGVAGPAMMLYARTTRWEQREFAATLQLVFLGMNILSVILKNLIGIGASALPPLWVAPGMLVLVVCGIGIGSLLEKRVSIPAARRTAEVLALVGSVVAIARGVLALT